MAGNPLLPKDLTLEVVTPEGLLLREQVDEGLDGYRSLVAAAGRVVAASSSPGPKQELTDATDHLAGLAVALRELSDAAG